MSQGCGCSASGQRGRGESACCAVRGGHQGERDSRSALRRVLFRDFLWPNSEGTRELAPLWLVGNGSLWPRALSRCLYLFGAYAARVRIAADRCTVGVLLAVRSICGGIGVREFFG